MLSKTWNTPVPTTQFGRTLKLWSSFILSVNYVSKWHFLLNCFSHFWNHEHWIIYFFSYTERHYFVYVHGAKMSKKKKNILPNGVYNLAGELNYNCKKQTNKKMNIYKNIVLFEDVKQKHNWITENLEKGASTFNLKMRKALKEDMVFDVDLKQLVRIWEMEEYEPRILIKSHINWPCNLKQKVNILQSYWELRESIKYWKTQLRK